MSHYTIGNRSKATNYFESALKHNPSLEVQTNETVNQSLVVFFEEVKKNYNEIMASNSPKKYRKTVIYIKSEVQGTVEIDGIYAGRTNTNLDAPRGLVEVRVAAPGYIETKVTINTVKKHVNIFKANLANQKTDQLTEKKSIFEKSKEDILNAQDESDGMFPEENEEELLSNKNNNDFSNIREVVEAKEAKTPSTVNKINKIQIAIQHKPVNLEHHLRSHIN